MKWLDRLRNRQMVKDIEARVEKGVELLDAKVPGWVYTIDLPTMDMRRANACLLAQVGGITFGGKDYYETLDKLHITEGGDYGFNLCSGRNYSVSGDQETASLYWEFLTDEWTEVVKERRGLE